MLMMLLPSLLRAVRPTRQATAVCWRAAATNNALCATFNAASTPARATASATTNANTNANTARPTGRPTEKTGNREREFKKRHHHPEDKKETNSQYSEVQIVSKPASAAFYTGNAPYYDILQALRIRLHKMEGNNSGAIVRLLREDPAESARLAKLFHAKDNLAALGILDLYADQFSTLLELISAIYVAGGEGLDYDPILEPFIKPNVVKLAYQEVAPIQEDGSAYAVGNRKTSRARVFVLPGTGEFKVNGVDVGYFFTHRTFIETAIYPLQLAQAFDKYNVWALVHGGGETGKAGAIAHGLAQTLVMHQHDLKTVMKNHHLLDRDARIAERKKPGMLKSRRKYSWAKR